VMYFVVAVIGFLATHAKVAKFASLQRFQG
jgi:hypothetical protein